MSVPAYTKKDFASDQEIRWCPGCGDYAILASAQTAFAKLGIPREKFVIVSGIGCSSRFPYYMSTYGFHSVHGRAPGIATGIKLANPDLHVWVITGDGDALAIGGNHFIHAMRRNVDLKMMLFNNRIYGLTKGQSSPTSEKGKKTASTPLGSIDPPFNPLALALGAGATFVARGVDRFGPHLQGLIERAAAHRGSALVEIYQNCNIFNDGTFTYVTDKDARIDHALYLEHGKPLRFGKDGALGVRLGASGLPEVVRVDDVGDAALLVHDERAPSPGLAFLLAQLEGPDFPVALGVLRAVDRPTLEAENTAQIERARAAEKRDLGALLRGTDTWEVR
ncbi:MAG: 2-oxoacid:ferredoxin oxidoreductase subunit beta [Acidobacteria bacterium]|nr:2-oxoacid:ferredoxin oxidoreductase subunit beta [Acidobacteriota bacterium]